ncbi:DUF481 domain-containing protein [Alteromonas lipotrueiana]|uniref:DUF481 domain-containing protein n=1 Tax=Alteromonas lipotrueiana TaxID=2803815 RepID=UPI001C44DDD0|nr:DUF481 domain-containing protein [Alteromonas lipotrueiana]
MQNQSRCCLLVLAICLIGSVPSYAADKNLIQTLYHTDFTYRQDENEELFSLDGELGILNSTGNTDAVSLKAGIAAEHETFHWDNNYSAELLYKQIEVKKNGVTRDQVSAQRFFGAAQFDYKLQTPGRRLFIYADYENDQFNGYNYRATLASGWSQRVWNTDESMLRYSVGPGYGLVSAEDGTQTNINNGFILRASGEYHFQWHTGSRFRQFLSAEIGPDNIKTRSETALSANLFDSLAMKLSFTASFETQPLPNVPNLNTETSLTVVYRFF